MSHTATCEREEHGHSHLEESPEAAATPTSAGTGSHPQPEPAPSAAGQTSSFSLVEVRWALAASVLFASAVVFDVAGAPTAMVVAGYVACYLSGGWGPTLAGLGALRQRRLDVDLLMVVAALGAAAIGQVFDGALLIVIFATSGALEAAATKRTRDSVRSLLSLAPEEATRLVGGADQRVPAAALEVGDIVLVRPGERVAADGEVIFGISEVDQASITGEALPVTKTVGDEVFAGSVNGTGMMHARVDRPAAESVIARIAALVDEAAATKARTQLFIEQVEQRYSVGVVAATIVIFFGPLAVGAPLQETLLRAMTFMIVASPCAVVLATMPPLLSAIANAGRHGVLVKDAVVMEQLGVTTVVCFDKTGTLTEGIPRVTHVLPADGVEPDTLLAVVAAAERASEHPLARAIVAAAHARNLHMADAEQFASQPGSGVAAVVDGHAVRVGRPDLLVSSGGDGGRLRKAISALEEEGQTVVVATVDGEPAGAIALSDQCRAGATEAVSRVASLTDHPPVVLTGDSTVVARRLALEAGIREVHAGLLPDGKLDVVRALQADGERVLVVGDGINDAPALAAANLGAAMRGSDLALETADLVVVRGDLATLPAVIELSRRARTVVAQNLAFAATAISVLVVLDLLGRLPLPVGVVGHEGSTVIVGLNGLRLLANRAWRPAPPAM
jgi:heavy metal translocating P-type ATPase